MTQEEKQLLLKDLCARLPYGVKINIDSPIEEQNQMVLFDVNLENETIGVTCEKYAFRAIHIVNNNEYDEHHKVIKPYLRPMSSMTYDERNLYQCKMKFVHSDDRLERKFYDTIESIDWLLAHHFDYRGLIEKGLALEAPDGMYM